jgi:Flp pilus assembly protein TadD
LLIASIWLALLAITPGPVTFDKDLAPLIFAHCAPCHHAGGVGPFPLITYQDVRKHAIQIGDVTGRRYMPPWPPEHGYGDFADDRSLSDRQIHLIADWIAQGEVQGNAADLPAAPQFNSEWQMGRPDLILRMKEPFRMLPGGSDVFRNFVISTGLKETRYVRALELHLNNTRVVHHANVVLDRTQSLRRRDGEDGKPGFPGMDVITETTANNFDPDSHFLFWKPGSVPRPEPDDMGWKLDPATDLILNLHLQPTGKEESVQAEVGIYFTSRAPTRFPMLIQLEHDGAIAIPPGDRTFSVTDSLRLPVDVDVLAIYPHAHYLGKLVEAWATLPDGSRRWLIRIPNWDINWQAVYDYRRPVPLPKGTEVAMRITYDNSQTNPRNPNQPPKLVTTGNRAEDEMGHVWLQVLPQKTPATTDDPRLSLEEAVMRRRLEKYPADFLAHYNLAALMEMRGKLDAAAAEYRSALAVDSRSATARNSLAGVLMLQDHVPDAIAQLREVLRLDPAYLNARYNLARALAASGVFLAARPDDTGAQAGIGTILFRQRRFPDALAHFQAAAQLDPNDADIETNLGTLLAITGNLPAAVHAFEEALRIDPNHQTARANLAKARAQMASRN